MTTLNPLEQYEKDNEYLIRALSPNMPSYPFINARHAALHTLFAESFLIVAADEGHAIIEAHGGERQRKERFGTGFTVRGSIARDAIKAALSAANVDFEVYG